jgi:hypothetical protein
MDGKALSAGGLVLACQVELKEGLKNGVLFINKPGNLACK